MTHASNELPDRGTDPLNGKPIATSAGRLWGWNTIFGRDGEHGTPYMTRIWFGRLRLHIFHRGDYDEDCHDHPWDFWTFPLTPYVEQVAVQTGQKGDYDENHEKRERHVFEKTLQVVPAWRWTFRPAEHCHRVLFAAVRVRRETGAKDPAGFSYDYADRKIVTLVWRGKSRRKWGFLKNREGKWCWVGWREYVFGGGKGAPCE